MDEEEIEQYQTRVERYLGRLLGLFRESESYAGAKFEPERHRVILYSVGAPTAAVSALMNEAPDILEPVWQEAPYTCDELCREVERLMRRFPQLNAGAAREDGAGLWFTTEDTDLLNTHKPQEALGSHYPVMLERGGQAVPL